MGARAGAWAACRESLWGAIRQGMEALVAEQGPEASRWRAAKVRISFPPDPLMTATMRWTNRSTFQQVIEFSGHVG